MQQFPRPLPDVADTQPGRAVTVAHARLTLAAEDGVDGRSRHAQGRPDAMWSPGPASPQLQHRRHLLAGGLARRTGGSRRAVLQARQPLALKPAQPLVHRHPRIPADSAALGTLQFVSRTGWTRSSRPKGVSIAPTMCHGEPPVRAGLSNSTQQDGSSYVNNLLGKYSSGPYRSFL
jgi:hypothetical protein